VHAAASAARRVPVARAAAIVARLKLRKIIRLVAFTPWLTASFGVVAAATVALAVPHPAITLPPAADGTCVWVSCHIGHRIHTDAAPKPRGELTPPAGPTRPARPPAKRPTRRLRQPAARVEVTYAVMDERQGRFLAEIDIRGQRPLGHWNLRFVLPGGTVERVQGGQWAASGQGVIVYGSSSQQGNDDQVQLLVYGSGTPGSPSGCAFDGIPCTFSVTSR
jgi:hypothetical protein